MSKTLGLALGSGGARGVAHIGVIYALEEAGIKPDFICGCSMGAVAGGCYASGMTAAQMRDTALGLKTRDLLDISPAFITRMAILRTKKLEDLLLTQLGDIRIEDMKIPFKCIATDVYSGKLHVFDSGAAALAIQASCTIPGVFRPVELEGELLVDGGVLCRVPEQLVKDMGADVVVSVDALANAAEPVDKLGNIVELLLRVFDVMDTNQTEMRRELTGHVADVEIKPEMKGINQYQIKELDRAFEEGYAAGKANVDRIKELLQ